MNNSDERDYAEEAANLATMREQDEQDTEHVHRLSYAHSVSTSPAGDTFAVERGTCECGEQIHRPIPYGWSPAQCDTRYTAATEPLDHRHRAERERAEQVAELVELVEQNMGADRLVSDAADFFTDPGGVLGYLLSPDRHEADGLDEAAREAFRVVARKHAGDLDDCGQAARHYLATGQAWDGWDRTAPDEDDACEGHESLAGEHMGEAVYCDGSCRRSRSRD